MQQYVVVLDSVNVRAYATASAARMEMIATAIIIESEDEMARRKVQVTFRASR